MDDWGRSNEAKETKPNTAGRSEIGPKGIQSMRGGEIAEPVETKNTTVPDQPLSPKNNAETVSALEFPGPTDPSELKYELGSPHKDYQAYKDLQAAERQHELGQQAATADSLGDAIDTTIAARKESRSSDETPMDTYFYEKHGRAPYTEDANPKDEGD